MGDQFYLLKKKGQVFWVKSILRTKKIPGFKSDRENCIFIDKKKKLWVKILFLIFLHFSLLLFKWYFSLQDKKNKLFFHSNRSAKHALKPCLCGRISYKNSCSRKLDSRYRNFSKFLVWLDPLPNFRILKHLF